MKGVELMTIKDVLQTEDFKKRLKNRLVALRQARRMAGTKGRLKAHVIETLIAKGEWNIESMTAYYSSICNKECALSSTARQFISAVVNGVYCETMAELIKQQDEKDAAEGGAR